MNIPASINTIISMCLSINTMQRERERERYPLFTGGFTFNLSYSRRRNSKDPATETTPLLPSSPWWIDFYFYTFELTENVQSAIL